MNAPALAAFLPFLLTAAAILLGITILVFAVNFFFQILFGAEVIGMIFAAILDTTGNRAAVQIGCLVAIGVILSCCCVGLSIVLLFVRCLSDNSATVCGLVGR